MSTDSKGEVTELTSPGYPWQTQQKWPRCPRGPQAAAWRAGAYGGGARGAAGRWGFLGTGRGLGSGDRRGQVSSLTGA